jgi:peptidylprolyl isomerase
MRCFLRRLLAVLVVPLLFLVACGGDGSGSGLSDITVQGGTGSAPQVEFADGFSVENTHVRTLVEGDGPKVGPTDTITLQYVGLNGRSGQQFDSSWSSGQPAEFTLGQGLIPGFEQALIGHRVGERVLVAIPPKDGYGARGNPQIDARGTDTLIFVIDILGITPTEATGSPVSVPPDLPHLITDAQGLPQQFHAIKETAPAPKQVEVHPVLQGSGEPITAGQTVSVSFLGEVYPAGSTFVDTYGQPPTSLPIGQGQPVPCFDELVGQKLGSRVILICPPDSAFGPQGNPQAGIKGTDTLIFAIDLLSAS